MTYFIFHWGLSLVMIVITTIKKKEKKNEGMCSMV